MTNSTAMPATTRTLRLKLNEGFAGAGIALLDRFFDPTDDRVPSQAIFQLPINAQGGLGQQKRLTLDQWHTLELAWDINAKRCRLRIDGQAVVSSPLNQTTPNGVSYLHLRSNASRIDPAGFLIESVEVTIADKTRTARSRADRGKLSPPKLSRFALTKIEGPFTGGAVLDVGESGQFDDRWVTCPTILRDARGYRMWYSSFYEDSQGPGGIGLAISSDGIRWERANNGLPVLTNGSPFAMDAAEVFAPEVLREDNNFSMWYTGMSKRRDDSGFACYRIFLARSTNGVHWQRENGGQPVLVVGSPGSFDSVQAATPSVLREEHSYRMWYAAWSPKCGHTIGAALSDNGVSWTRENQGQPVEGLQPSAAYGPAVCRVGDQLVLFYMAQNERHSLYAAASQDGIHWRMLNGGEPVLTPGALGAFDDAIVGHPFAMVDGNKLRLWSTGYRRDPGGVNGWKLRIGLAESNLISMCDLTGQTN